MAGEVGVLLLMWVLVLMFLLGGCVAKGSCGEGNNKEVEEEGAGEEACISCCTVEAELDAPLTRGLFTPGR